MIALMGLSQAGVRALVGQPQVFDPSRGVAIVLYLAFAFVTWWRLRRVQPSPRAARQIPLLLAVIDAAFPCFMAIRTFQMTGSDEFALTAAHGGLLVCFSAARM